MKPSDEAGAIRSAETSSRPESKVPLSVYFITQNEEDRIERSLSRVLEWADEVIVVDSGSTDRTCELATALGARVVHHAWEGYATQKAYAATLCRNNWVLDLDADEVLSDELVAQIKALFQPLPSDEYGAFEFNWKIVLPFDSKPRPGMKSNWIVRLYHKKKTKVIADGEASINDRAKVHSGKIGRLSGVVFHYSYRDFADIERKWSELTSQQAAYFRSRKRRVAGIRIYLEFPLQFLKFYVFRRMFLWGWYGYVLAIMSAQRQMMRLAKLRELEIQGEKSDGQPN